MRQKNLIININNMQEDILRDDIEYIIHSDSSGKIIGPISKVHAHLESVRAELTHYSTWAMIYHLPTGKYGLQQKNPKKHDKYGAGKWDMGVAGHNCYYKKNKIFKPLDFDENLIKEAKEEIGVDVKINKTKKEFLKNIKNKLDFPQAFIFENFHYKSKTDNEWVGMGIIVTNSLGVKFEDDEVIDFKWLLPEEFEKYLQINNDYCSVLPTVFKKTEKFRKETLI